MVRDRVRDGIIILVDRARAGDRDGQARSPIQEVLRVGERRFRLQPISSIFYTRILRMKVFMSAFSTYMLLEKSCQKDVRTKNYRVKC